MKVAVLVEDLYQVLEVWYPYLRLREAGITTVLVGTGRKQYKSKEGYPADEEIAITSVKAQDFDGVVIPGGYAPDILRRYQEINHFVSEMFKQGRLVASICHGGWVLASAGVLKGRKATSFSAIKDDVINAGAEYLDQEVVVDRNLITSRNPNDLPAFCTQIIAFLNNKPTEYKGATMKIEEKNGQLVITEFNEFDAYRIAQKIEHDGIDFYQRIHSLTSKAQIRSTMEFLVEEEKRHVQFFDSCLETLRTSGDDTTEDDDLISSLDYGVFTVPQSDAVLAQNMKDFRSAINMAIGMEIKSVLFYEQCRNKITAQHTKEQLEVIIAEEKKHRKLLESIIE